MHAIWCIEQDGSKSVLLRVSRLVRSSSNFNYMHICSIARICEKTVFLAAVFSSVVDLSNSLIFTNYFSFDVSGFSEAEKTQLQ